LSERKDPGDRGGKVRAERLTLEERRGMLRTSTAKRIQDTEKPPK
jgi:hypothetical protein